ncbi:MAG: rRNA maturation RNase YbeY [Dehalococcoidia bacterium]|nr:rRNA maturation RNase YbeY [Dehalococcoidia bacterium]
MPPEIAIELQGPATRGLAPEPLRALLERVLAAEGAGDASLTLVLAGDALLRRLNREHRGLDEPTDVLSFPTAEGEEGAEGEPFPGGDPAEGGARYLGDIAVSVSTARRQARRAGLALDEELAHLALHGLLHLLGYDHETAAEDAAMRAREELELGARVHAWRGHEDRA